jgi:hypothetical protein
MPKPKSEEDKKHGDKLESLISRTGAASRDESDESDDEEEPAELQDDDDEDVQNDDPESRRDVGERR